MKYLLLIVLALVLMGCSREKKGSQVAMESTEGPVQATSVSETEVHPQAAMAVEPELMRPLVNPQDVDFVRVKDYIPDIVTDLKYATEDNFTGQVIYDFEDVFLRYGTVMKLKAVAEELAPQGLVLKLWDGFRPVSAQFRLWEICPDDTYVADPNKGYSNHSRGFAVDVTLVDNQGREVEMPTGFDDFSAQADRDYSECSETARENAVLLESVMEKQGFKGYWGEWWHFNDTKKYEVETCFDPEVICLRETVSDAPLLDAFWDEASLVLTVPAGENVTLLGCDDGFALVEYWGYRGYIPMESLK